LAVTFLSANTTAGTNVTITGGEGNDTLTGVANADTITGGAGADILAGGTGSDTVNGGAGDDVITYIFETTSSDTLTGGAGGDTFTQGNVTSATILTATITDFDLGTSSTAIDKFVFDISALKGLSTVTDIVDTGAVSSGDGDGTIVTLSTDGGTITGADLVVLSQTYASSTLALAGLKTAGSDTIIFSSSLANNDAFLIAYTNGTDGFIAVATTSATSSTSDDVDSVEVILTLTGISSFANFDSTDFSYVA
jgi:Ca2+-binding RTX toxin-like protein